MDDTLQQAIVSLREGRRVQARGLLERVVQSDPASEQGWLWLAEAVDTDEERRFCLARVLSINHRNGLARRRLEALGWGAARSPLLLRAVAALTVGDRAAARALLDGALRTEPRSEEGWLRLAEAVDTDQERRFCLSWVLAINRRNGLARRGLELLGPGPTRAPLAGWGAPPELLAPAELPVAAAPAGRPAPVLPRPLLDRRAVLIALIYLVAITLAEVLTAFTPARLGLLLHSLLLVALLLHTSLTWEQPGYRFLLSLALAPLIRLLSLSLPLAGFQLIYWYFIISVPLLTATLLAARVMGFGRKDGWFSLRGWPLQLAVALIGPLLGYVEYYILHPNPLARNLSWSETWLPALILMVCTGFAEELIFRGVMQQAAYDVLGRWSNLYVSALFAVLHVGYHSLTDVLFVFAVALIFGWVKTRTGSLIGISLAHGLTNIFLFLVVPFLR